MNCMHNKKKLFSFQASARPHPPFLFHFSKICSSSISLKALELFLLKFIFFKAIINLLWNLYNNLNLLILMNLHFQEFNKRPTMFHGRYGFVEIHWQVCLSSGLLRNGLWNSGCGLVRKLRRPEIRAWKSPGPESSPPDYSRCSGQSWIRFFRDES
jgi:hypothetical protein